MQRRFLLHYKLVLIFGLLFLIAGMIESLFSIGTARKALTQKTEKQLTDKAADLLFLAIKNLIEPLHDDLIVESHKPKLPLRGHPL